MSPIDRDLLAERALTIERHLARVAARLPATADGFAPATDASATRGFIHSSSAGWDPFVAGPTLARVRGL